MGTRPRVKQYTDKFGNPRVRVDRMANNPLGEAFSRLAQASKEKQETEETGEDLNVLPLPIAQEIASKFIQWTWEPCNFVKIYGILYTKDQSIETVKGSHNVFKGTYEVQFSTSLSGVSKDETILIYSEEESKAIGHAMLSASNWINVWKQHAGMFLERELLGADATPSTEVERFDG